MMDRQIRKVMRLAHEVCEELKAVNQYGESILAAFYDAYGDIEGIDRAEFDIYKKNMLDEYFEHAADLLAKLSEELEKFRDMELRGDDDE